MKIFLILFLLVVLYIYLIAPRILFKPDCSPLCGVHYAHRGLFDNNSLAPENSLKAFQNAVEAGYGIELDVQLSKDGIPIVFHDATLERMCQKSGKIQDYTLAELKRFSLAHSKAQIPTLSEALSIINGQVPIIVEYKMHTLKPQVCHLGNELLKNYKGNYCVESFHPLALLWYRIHRPDIVRGQLSESFWHNKEMRTNIFYAFLSYMIFNVLSRPDFIAYRHCHAFNLSRRICRFLGALSVAWTIKNQEQYKKAKRHFDLFIFDSCKL